MQQEIGKFLLDVGYVGTKGTDLAVAYNINQAYAGAGTAASRFPYQGFNTITYQDSMGNSTYNSLQIRVQRRYSNGISLLMSYTWSKSIDLGSGSLVADLTFRNVTGCRLGACGIFGKRSAALRDQLHVCAAGRAGETVSTRRTGCSRESSATGN